MMRPSVSCLIPRKKYAFEKSRLPDVCKSPAFGPASAAGACAAAGVARQVSTKAAARSDDPNDRTARVGNIYSLRLAVKNVDALRGAPPLQTLPDHYRFVLRSFCAATKPGRLPCPRLLPLAGGPHGDRRQHDHRLPTAALQVPGRTWPEASRLAIGSMRSIDDDRARSGASSPRSPAATDRLDSPTMLVEPPQTNAKDGRAPGWPRASGPQTLR